MVTTREPHINRVNRNKRNPLAVASDVLAHVDEKAIEYITQFKAPNTMRSYESDWSHFASWCMAMGVPGLPADTMTIARYITYLADMEQRKTSTIQRRLSSINQKHRQNGLTPISTRDESLHSVWEGIRRVNGTAQQGKAPITVEDIRVMVDSLPSGLLGIRDRALLLIGFAGAFRRSELVGLNAEDLEFTRDGLIVHLRRSKTDQEGQGRKIGIPYGSNPDTCPVRAVQSWMNDGEISAGPLFRAVNRHGQIHRGRLSDKAVALIVKRCAKSVGLDETRYAGHSLRAGLATSAAIAGVSEHSIMAQTGHKSVGMVRRYIRDGNLFRNNAAGSVGL